MHMLGILWVTLPVAKIFDFSRFLLISPKFSEFFRSFSFLIFFQGQVYTCQVFTISPQVDVPTIFFSDVKFCDIETRLLIIIGSAQFNVSIFPRKYAYPTWNSVMNCCLWICLLFCLWKGIELFELDIHSSYKCPGRMYQYYMHLFY